MPNAPATHRGHARTHEQARGNATARGYDRQWRNARAAFLASHPVCECDDCTRTGQLLLATVVDHRTPHRGDSALFWDEANWQAMSKAHHDAKTAREVNGRRG